MKTKKCSVHGGNIRKGSPYVGLKNPQGKLELMCVKCYEKNGGNVASLKRVPGESTPPAAPSIATSSNVTTTKTGLKHFKKGSPEAKAFMAELRARRMKKLKEQKNPESVQESIAPRLEIPSPTPEITEVADFSQTDSPAMIDIPMVNPSAPPKTSEENPKIEKVAIVNPTMQKVAIVNPRKTAPSPRRILSSIDRNLKKMNQKLRTLRNPVKKSVRGHRASVKRAMRRDPHGEPLVFGPFGPCRKCGSTRILPPGYPGDYYDCKDCGHSWPQKRPMRSRRNPVIKCPRCESTNLTSGFHGGIKCRDCGYMSHPPEAYGRTIERTRADPWALMNPHRRRRRYAPGFIEQRDRLRWEALQRGRRNLSGGIRDDDVQLLRRLPDENPRKYLTSLTRRAQPTVLYCEDCGNPGAWRESRRGSPTLCRRCWFQYRGARSDFSPSISRNPRRYPVCKKCGNICGRSAWRRGLPLLCDTCFNLGRRGRIPTR